MTGVNSINDLFEHELKDIYDAESRLVDALRQQANETKTPALKQAFEQHQKQTEQQKQRLEKVFGMLNKEPSRGSGCAGIEGLLTEHKEFVGKQPPAEILDVFNMGAAVKVERYEITAYEGLIQLATQLELTEAVEVLNQNLKEEQQTLERVQALMKSDNPIKQQGGKTQQR